MTTPLKQKEKIEPQEALNLLKKELNKSDYNFYFEHVDIHFDGKTFSISGLSQSKE